MSALWQWLTDLPPEKYSNRQQYRQAQLLSAMILVMALMGLTITALLSTVLDPSTAFYEDSEFWIVLIGALSLILPYQLNRRGQYRIAARLFIYLCFLIIYLCCIPTDLMLDLNLLVFLVLPVLLSSTFVSSDSTLRLIVIEAISVAALPLLDNVTVADILWQLSFLILTSILILVATRHRAGIEIDRRREVEESDERYRTMFNSSVQAVMVHDGHYVLIANDVAARIVGYQRAAEVIGKSFLNFIHPEEVSLIATYAQQRLRGEDPPERYETRLVAVDGAVRWVDARSSALMLDGRRVTMVNAVDITERKQTEAVLRRQNAYFAALHETALDLMNRRTVHEMLQAILSRAGQLTHTEHGYIYLLSPDGSTMINDVAMGVFTRYTNGKIYPGEGLTGKVWDSGQPLIIEDYDEWAGRLTDFERDIFHAAVGVPMLSAGKVVGVIALVHCEPGRRFLVEAIEVLQRFADLATIALDNARLYADLTGRNRMLEALTTISGAISSVLDLEQVLTLAVRLTAQVLDATSAYMCDWNAETGNTTVLAEYISPHATEREGVSDIGVTYTLRERDGNFPGWLADPVRYLMCHVDDDSNIGTEKRNHMAQYDAKSLLAVPLTLEGKAFAYIEVWESRRRREFVPEEIELLQSVANQAALAFNRGKLYNDLRASEARNAAIIHASPDLIFRMSREGVYLDILGGSFEELIIPAAEMRGKNIREVLPSPIPEIALKTIEWVLSTGELHSFEYQLEMAIGLQHYEARIVKSGAAEVFIFVRNITQRIQAQSQAIMLSVERARVRLLEDFISDASHDLKTPLTNIKSRLYLLKKAKDEDSRHRQLEVLDSEIYRLERLITDLLMMAQLDNHQSKFGYEAVDLNYLISETISGNQAVATQRGVNLIFTPTPDLPRVSGDPTQLSRVLENLLSNAINYTPSEGTVTVRVFATEKQCVVEVSDTGMGISVEDLPHIFERFFRADKARSGDTGGTGLGLSIARKIVELHGGSISAESEVGVGSTFRLSLPIRLFKELI